ncbi:hypothetical protein ACODNH_14935 [Haloarcula sp. NS06]
MGLVVEFDSDCVTPRCERRMADRGLDVPVAVDVTDHGLGRGRHVVE